MKISFIGSSNLSLFKEEISSLFSFDGDYFNIEKDGIISFLDKIRLDEEFASKLIKSDFIFLDLLSDTNFPKDNADILQSSYQDLIWHLHSISPHCQIIFVNCFQKEFYDFKFLKIINNFNFKNCSYMKPFFSHSESKDSHHVKNLISEVFNATDRVESVAESYEDNSESNLTAIINKLKNKKEFETTTNKV